MFFLHPVIVHFAIALLSVAVVFDFLFLISKKERFWYLTNYLLVPGTISAIGAVLTGHEAKNNIELPDDLNSLVNSHELSGEYTMWIFIFLLIFRFILVRFDGFRKKIRWAYYGFAFIAVIFLFRTGLLGGEMVYVHGLGPVRQNTATPPPASFEIKPDTSRTQ